VPPENKALHRGSLRVWPTSTWASWIGPNNLPGEPESQASADARFKHFVTHVCQLSVWREEAGALFRELQVMPISLARVCLSSASPIVWACMRARARRLLHVICVCGRWYAGLGEQTDQVWYF
jgi:hypothetical protein